MDQCFTCKKDNSELKKCSNCLSISYCSKECQRNDWKRHKLECEDKKKELDNRKREHYELLIEEFCSEKNWDWYTTRTHFSDYY
jgi:hypothetical protein